MAPVKKKPHVRSKHFIKEWRLHREISQEDAADRVGVSRGTLSKIENGSVPYNQDLIERLAVAYGTEPMVLIGRNPMEEPKIPIFDLPKGDSDRVYEFIRALRISRESDQPLPAGADATVSRQKKPSRSGAVGAR